MKIACKCGNVISDISDMSPDKAWFLPTEDTDIAVEWLATDFVRFIEARDRGEEEQYWREEHIPSPAHASLKERVFQAIGNANVHFGRPMYECDQCGRIWLQARNDAANLVSYQPESPLRGILRHDGARESQDA